jgi:proteasome lid subunit RPN8/RPN11
MARVELAPSEERPALSLHLSRPQLRLIESGARLARPLEYCAILLGRRGKRYIIATDVLRLRNSDARRNRFSIADIEIRRGELVAMELECEIVAIVHSHASCLPIPSETDRRAMTLSRFPWLIVGFDVDDSLRLAAFDAVSGKSLPMVADGS